MSDAETREPNLLIIRRGGSAELETPKGGVWKIAYADFMTAMMAFFLVMWLINATSETTKTGVANYFNPIKLADGTQLPKKGLQDPEQSEKSTAEETVPDQTAKDEAAHGAAEEASEHAEERAAEAEKSAHDSSEKKAKFSEEALFRDPYAVLAAIAAQADGTTSLVAKGDWHGSVGAGGADQAGESYGDPFDPAAWQVTAPAMAEGPLGSEAEAGDLMGAIVQGGAGEPQHGATAELVGAIPASGAHAEEAGVVPTPRQAHAATAGNSSTVDEATEHPAFLNTGLNAGMHATGRQARADADQEKPGDRAHAEAGEGQSAEPAHVAAGEGNSDRPAAGGADGDAEALPPLRHRIAEALASVSRQMPRVTIENADGGVLISLADQVAFGMFAVGSAEPLPETIAVMEKIAALLNTLPGKVIIRGHTDGRPFRSGDYDNWRLSSARAHMAYHMLVRGGLDDGRVQRIEGYADRDLKLPDDPDAAENRRIDILVQEVQS